MDNRECLQMEFYQHTEWRLTPSNESYARWIVLKESWPMNDLQCYGGFRGVSTPMIMHMLILRNFAVVHGDYSVRLPQY